MQTPGLPEDDFVTRLGRAWQHSLPEVDSSSLELIGRMNRISVQSTRQVERMLAPHGLTRSEFDVLCALARSEQPLRASEVTAQTMLSGAATTKLASRLAESGLLRRSSLERDGRVVLLELTPEGHGLVVKLLPECFAIDQTLLSGLSEDEREVLAGLLRKVSQVSERSQLP